jgi:hypothetical protein
MRIFPSGRATLAILAVALACVGLACLLPTNPYQRRVQLDGTIYDTTRWIYERTHYDPAPVDVAFVGASRTMLAINAPRLEADLAARGIPARVANFAVIGSGRNIQALMLGELMDAKRPKLLVIEVNEHVYPFGHQAYGPVAPNAAILAPPLFGLHDWPYHLIELPYRNVHLFAAKLFPQAFGIPDSFDPARYRGTTPDTTRSFRLPTGRLIDMDAHVPRATLEAGARAFEARKPPHAFPPAIAARVYGDDRVYTQAIVDAARAHGIPVAFLFLPYFSGPTTIDAQDFYAARGTVLNGGFVAQQPDLYEGWAHLNRRGAAEMTDWVADRIAPLMTATQR